MNIIEMPSKILTVKFKLKNPCFIICSISQKIKLNE